MLEPLRGSPFGLRASSGQIATSQTSVVSGLDKFVTGDRSSFVVTVRDKNENEVPDGYLAVVATLQWKGYRSGAPGIDLVDDTEALNAELGTQFRAETPALYQGSGVYTVSFSAWREGDYEVDVKLDGQLLRGSPFPARGYTFQRKLLDGSWGEQVPAGDKCVIERGSIPATMVVGNALKI